MTPWDQRAARYLVKPLARAAVTPNQLTVLTMVLALLGAGLLGAGDPVLANWGAAVFALSRFLDHFDGELARLTGQATRLGYYLDYIAGVLAYAGLFIGIGIGLATGPLGAWALVCGGIGATCAFIAMPLNLGRDSLQANNDAIGYPAFAGFELEDGIYLLVPATWCGLLPGFFVLAGASASVYVAWTLYSYLRERMER
jgi:archaetidylinositol phosphate synthase